MRVLYLFLLCITFGQSWATVEELAINIQKQAKDIGQDLATSTLVHLYQQVADNNKDEVADAYGDMKGISDLDKAKQQLEQAAQQAAPAQAKAPAGVSDSFKAVVDKVANSKAENLPEYTADALRYLFGDEPQTMDLPQEAKGKAKEQPGYRIEQAASVEADFNANKK